MKVIHVAGWSGSGKTTFITDLVAALSALGPVGTVKHIGEHVVDLPEGKDTTLHYGAGAAVTAGVDLEKTMITSRSDSLQSALTMLADAGMRYAVVEGFKAVRFRKVVIGDLDVPAVLRNPAVSDVLEHLDEFDDYYTLSGLICEDRDEPGEGMIVTMTTAPRAPISREQGMRMEEEFGQVDGVSLVRVRCSPPVFGDLVPVYVVIRADSAAAGMEVLIRCEQMLSSPVPVISTQEAHP